MFSLGVENRVPSEVDVAHVVAEEANWIRDGNAQVLQDAFEPDSFARDDCCTPVIGLRGRRCDCRWLLAALGDRSVAKGEDESGSQSFFSFIVNPVGIGVPFESNWCQNLHLALGLNREG